VNRCGPVRSSGIGVPLSPRHQESAQGKVTPEAQASGAEEAGLGRERVSRVFTRLEAGEAGGLRVDSREDEKKPL
jgi:hypothetical protein